MYTDKRGWLYMVKPDLSGKQFKAFYRKPNPRKPLDEGWYACRGFTWRGTAADAIEDLDAIAKSKGWKPAI